MSKKKAKKETVSAEMPAELVKNIDEFVSSSNSVINFSAFVRSACYEKLRREAAFLITDSLRRQIKGETGRKNNGNT